MARRSGARPEGTSGATPAVMLLTREHVPFTGHRFEPDPQAESYGDDACAGLGVAPDRVFKTLVVDLAVGGGKGLGVAILPVDRRLDLKAAGAGFGVKRVALADRAAAERSTGYVLGGISPFGQRTRLPAVLDVSALDHRTIYVSGGRRGFDVELAPTDLVRVLGARTAPLTC